MTGQSAGGTPYFPVFIDLSDKPVLIVGAGKVASRRAGVLAAFRARITVVAPDGCETMEQLVKDGAVVWLRRCFEPSDLDGKQMVITAASDAGLNERIVNWCREQKILVNHAGDKSQCDFYFPGIARQDSIVAGICTSGSDPGQTARLTRQLKAWLLQAADIMDGGEKQNDT